MVQPDHPTFPTFGLATFDQPPFSFLLPSWDLMIPHGSGQRMTRKHSSSPVVAGGNSGGKNPTVRRIHGPAFRLYRDMLNDLGLLKGYLALLNLYYIYLLHVFSFGRFSSFGWSDEPKV